MAESSAVKKVGPWGVHSSGGHTHDVAVPPAALNKITIYSGDVVDSISFDYTGSDGKPYVAGRWGGRGGAIRTITLAAGEYVTEVTGAHGYFYGHEAISELTIKTNQTTHRPYGTYKLDREQTFIFNDAGSIVVGFFAKTSGAGLYVSAIGVYTKPLPPPPPPPPPTPAAPLPQTSLLKLGPWGFDDPFGADEDELQDVTVLPVKLEKITVYSDDVVDSISFEYTDSEGKKQVAGPWGGSGGEIRTINLGAKYVTEIKGVYGTYQGKPAISKLIVKTNTSNHGQYGTKKLDNEQAFSIPVADGGSIVGFFAKTGELYVSAIGVYAKPPEPGAQ